MTSRIAACAVTLLALAGSAVAEPPRLVVSPAAPTTSDAIRLTVLGDTLATCAPYFVAVVDAAARRITLRGEDFNLPPMPCPVEPWSQELAIGFLAAGHWDVVATLEDAPYSAARVEVLPAPAVVALGSFEYFGTNFRLEVDWVDPATGELRHAPGLALSDRAAQFWFFEPAIPEVTVKILDGSAINEHHWLFASSMTGVEFTLRVRRCVEGDPPFCEAPLEYHSPAGDNLDVVDVRAFPN